MGEKKESPGWFVIFSFLLMVGAYAATVILLVLAPVLSDAPLAWLGVPAGIVLIWVGRGFIKGKWSR